MEGFRRKLARDDGAFRPPTRIHQPPPEKFIAPNMIGGLKHLLQQLSGKKNIPTKHEPGSQTDVNGRFLSKYPVAPLAGRYKLIQSIGEGQSSVLVAAEDLFHPSKCAVAIKIMHLSYTNLGSQEADCVLQLNRADPLEVSRTVRLLNKFTFDGHYCMVFELLRPRPLHRYFQNAQFDSEERKLDMIKEIAVQGEEENIVARGPFATLKADLCLFPIEGDKVKIKVVDFGNAIRWIHREVSLYYDEFEIQTILYRAPEVMFGVPFGQEIDMWSLGCILAELYLGKPMFFGRTKTAVLQEMIAVLGLLPRIPFQSGKFFSEFSSFTGQPTNPEGSSLESRLMKRLHNTRNFIFANFLVGLLRYNPSHRFTPSQAAAHPFLASELPLAYYTSQSYSGREHNPVPGPTYSGILLSSEEYTHRPHIDDGIKRMHFSGLELLRVGTRGSKFVEEIRTDPPPVGRVVPLVYRSVEECGTQEKSISNKDIPKIEYGSRATEEIMKIEDQRTSNVLKLDNKFATGPEQTYLPTANARLLHGLASAKQEEQAGVKVKHIKKMTDRSTIGPSCTPDWSAKKQFSIPASTPDRKPTSTKPPSTSNSNINAELIQDTTDKSMVGHSCTSSRSARKCIKISTSTPDHTLTATQLATSPDVYLNAECIQETTDRSMVEHSCTSDKSKRERFRIPVSTPERKLTSTKLPTTPDANTSKCSPTLEIWKGMACAASGKSIQFCDKVWQETSKSDSKSKQLPNTPDITPRTSLTHDTTGEASSVIGVTSTKVRTPNRTRKVTKTKPDRTSTKLPTTPPKQATKIYSSALQGNARRTTIISERSTKVNTSSSMTGMLLGTERPAAKHVPGQSMTRHSSLLQGNRRKSSISADRGAKGIAEKANREYSLLSNEKMSRKDQSTLDQPLKRATPSADSTSVNHNNKINQPRMSTAKGIELDSRCISISSSTDSLSMDDPESDDMFQREKISRNSHIQKLKSQDRGTGLPVDRSSTTDDYSRGGKRARTSLEESSDDETLVSAARARVYSKNNNKKIPTGRRNNTDISSASSSDEESGHFHKARRHSLYEEHKPDSDDDVILL